jgi:hypothetical protein
MASVFTPQSVFTPRVRPPAFQPLLPSLPNSPRRNDIEPTLAVARPAPVSRAVPQRAPPPPLTQACASSDWLARERQWRLDGTRIEDTARGLDLNLTAGSWSGTPRAMDGPRNRLPDQDRHVPLFVVPHVLNAGAGEPSRRTADIRRAPHSRPFTNFADRRFQYVYIISPPHREHASSTWMP